MTDIYNYFKEHNLNSFEDVKAHFQDLCKINETDEHYLLRYRSGGDNSILSLLRGVVFNKSTNKLVCYPLTGAISFEDFQNKADFSEIVIEESIDGTLINIWYDNGWHVSTKSCVDANDSTWVHNKSYKVLFDECGFEVSDLDTNYCYSLVLCHPENRIVTPYTEPQLYHVLSRNMTTFQEEYLEIGLPKPTVLKMGDKLNILNVNSYENIENILEDLEFDKEGFMLFSKDRCFRIKLKGNMYESVKELRGNNRNIKYRLLELNRDNKLEEFLNFYPEHLVVWDELQENINKAIDETLFLYNKIKKEKVYTEIPFYLKVVIYELHQEYKRLLSKYREDKHDYKPSINKAKITHYYKNMPTQRLYFILNRI